jgi:hypothetical protein
MHSFSARSADNSQLQDGRFARLEVAMARLKKSCRTHFTHENHFVTHVII